MKGELSLDNHIGRNRAIDYVFRIIDIPVVYYIVAVVIATVVWLTLQKPEFGMLAGYVFLILAETLLIRIPFEGSHLQAELFWSWRA